MTSSTPSTKRRRFVKPAMLWLHRWVGIVLGLYFVIMGLSGTLLVYEHPIDAWLNPSLVRAANILPDRAPLDVAVASAQLAAPDKPISRIHWHGGAEDVYEFCLGPWGPDAVFAYVDPYTGELLGQRKLMGSVVGFTTYLHFMLLGGRTGWYANSVGGWVMAIVLLTGIVLWWPRTLRVMWQRLKIALGSTAKRINFDTHNAVGAWTFVLLFVATVTGALFAVMPPIGEAVYGLFGGAPPARVSKPESTTGDFLPMQSLLATATAAAAPHDVEPLYWYRVVLPSEKKGVFEARFSNETRAATGKRIEVTLDGRTGKLLRLHDTAAGSRAERAMAMILPLHVGTFGGPVMEAVYALLGLVPLVLFVTGIVMWLNKRKPRRPERSPV